MAARQAKFNLCFNLGFLGVVRCYSPYWVEGISHTWPSLGFSEAACRDSEIHGSMSTRMWRQSDFRRAIQQQGCCLCEDKRKRLPISFRETTKNPGLEDNKHALVQTTYTMVGRLYVDLTICWELLSGLYYQEFEAMLDASDVATFS